MAYIDIILDGNNETTPTFGIWDALPIQDRIAVQAVRPTDTTAVVNIALDKCVLLEDGTLLQMHIGNALIDAWHQIDSDYIAFAAADHTESADTEISRLGFAYRLRYSSVTTDPIRVVVPLGKRPRPSAPALLAAAVDGTSLTLDFHLDLYPNSLAAVAAFTVNVDGSDVTVSSRALANKRITLTLATAVTAGEVVLVSYEVPAANPLQNKDKVNVETFEDVAVTNNT